MNFKLFLSVPLLLCAGAALADPGDQALTAQVKSAIGKTPGLEGLPIHVTTVGGVVRLTGSVPGGVQVDKAQDAASRVHGVKEINNQLVPQQDS
jgi:hyperosmotically inducible periplasmic protein